MSTATKERQTRRVGGSMALLRRLAAQSLDYVGQRIPAVWDVRWDPAATDMQRVYYHPDPAALRRLSPAEQVAAYFALSDHEVGGHLRFTDSAVWDAFVQRQLPHLRRLAHTLVNILEDARIERAHAERWPATRARLAWLNERYYQTSPEIRPSMPPAEALMMALNQAKFGWYYGHMPGYKGQLPAEVEGYWPQAEALLDEARYGSTTTDVVRVAEAILEAMMERGWLQCSPDLLQQLGLNPHLDEYGSPKAPGTTRPEEAPPQAESAGPKPQTADQSADDDGASDEDAPDSPVQPDAATEDADEADAASAGEDASGEADHPEREDGAAKSAGRQTQGSSPEHAGDDAGDEEEAGRPTGQGPGSGSDPAGNDTGDGEATGASADSDDAGETPAADPEPETLGEPHQERGDPGAATAPATAAADADADAQRVLDDASAVLAAMEREDRDYAQAAAATMQEVEAMGYDLGPIRAEGLPPDLHVGILPEVQIVPPNPFALEPVYHTMRPEGVRLAQALERVLERQRSIRRGLRRGKPDPVRIRLEELSDRVYLQRPRRASHFDVAVLVMCDESGSMSGMRCRRAREALMMFHVALQRLGIRHAAAGFSAGGAQVLHRVYFGFGQSLHPSAWWHLVNAPDATLNAYALANARDGYSLRWGARWLASQPEVRKVLIFLSDGEVNHDWARSGARHEDYHYGMNNPRRVGAWDTRAAVREAERLGVTVIGVSIGEKWGYMAELYPRRVCCRHVTELPDALARILLGLVAGSIGAKAPLEPGFCPAPGFFGSGLSASGVRSARRR